MHRLNRELPETEVRNLFFLPLDFEKLLVVCLEKEKTIPAARSYDLRSFIAP